jgi:hypothetical protein
LDLVYEFTLFEHQTWQRNSILKNVSHQIKRILKNRCVIIFVGDKDGDVNVGKKRRFAEVVSSESDVETSAVRVSVGVHQLEVDGPSRPDFAADRVDGEVAASVATNYSISNLKANDVMTI